MDENCNENGTVSAYKLLNFYSILQSPQSNSSAIIQILNATTIDLNTGAETIKTITSNNDLKPTKTIVNSNLSTCSCSNVLKQADFYFILSNQIIQNVSVSLVFYSDIPETVCSTDVKYKQSFSLQFLTASYVNFIKNLNCHKFFLRIHIIRNQEILVIF